MWSVCHPNLLRSVRSWYSLDLFPFNSMLFLIMINLPSFQVSALSIHPDHKWRERAWRLRHVWILQWLCVPSPCLLCTRYQHGCWMAQCSQSVSSDPSGVSLLFGLHTFSKAKDDHLAQPGRWGASSFGEQSSITGA